MVNLQLRLMDVAGDAQTLGAAMNHASLNLANALGRLARRARDRGRVRLPARPRSSVSLLSVAGFLVVVASAFAHRRTARAAGLSPGQPRSARCASRTSHTSRAQRPNAASITSV